MTTGNDGVASGSYPNLYDFCTKIRAYAEGNHSEDPLGLSSDGELLSENEFDKKYGATDSWSGWALAKVKTVTDTQGLTFNQYQENLVSCINNYAAATQLNERGISSAAVSDFSGSGLRPLACNFEESALKPFLPNFRPYTQNRSDNNAIPYLPEIREGDYRNLMAFLEKKMSEEFASDFIDDHSRRALFQELCSISSARVKELAIRKSGSYRDNKTESELLNQLTSELRAKRSLALATPLTVEDSDTPASENLFKPANSNGRAFTTCKEQLNFTGSMRSLGVTPEDLRDMDYEITVDKDALNAELAENREKAAAQDKDKETTGHYEKFQQLLEGKLEFRTPAYGYEIQYIPQDMPSTGIAGAGGDISHDMEDLATAFVRHGTIAGQWVPVKMTAVLDGHSSKNDNSAARKTAQYLPSAAINRLESHNSDQLTKVGLVSAFQAMASDLDRKEDYKSGGTTLNLATGVGQYLCIVNVGDSRAIYVNPQKAPSEAGGFIQLSEDAEIIGNSNARYDKQALDRGGEVTELQKKPGEFRIKTRHPTHEGDRGIGCASSIGDHIYDGAVCPRAVVTLFDQSELSPEGYIIQMSDGMTKVATTEQMARLVHKLVNENNAIAPNKIAASLRDHAAMCRPGDDLMVVVTPVKALLQGD